MELCDRKFSITQEIERERERERVKGFCKAAQNVQTATIQTTVSLQQGKRFLFFSPLSIATCFLQPTCVFFFFLGFLSKKL
jgi:hypothetical protein